MSRASLSPMMDDGSHPAQIIADLLAAALIPRDGWASARSTYGWERRGLDYLARLKANGERPPINDWTAMLVDEGYPAKKAGALCGKYWKPLRDGKEVEQ